MRSGSAQTNNIQLMMTKARRSLLDLELGVVIVDDQPVPPFFAEDGGKCLFLYKRSLCVVFAVPSGGKKGLSGSVFVFCLWSESGHAVGCGRVLLFTDATAAGLYG